MLSRFFASLRKRRWTHAVSRLLTSTSKLQNKYSKDIIELMIINSSIRNLGPRLSKWVLLNECFFCIASKWNRKFQIGKTKKNLIFDSPWTWSGKDFARSGSWFSDKMGEAPFYGNSCQRSFQWWKEKLCQKRRFETYFYKSRVYWGQECTEHLGIMVTCSVATCCTKKSWICIVKEQRQGRPDMTCAALVLSTYSQETERLA